MPASTRECHASVMQCLSGIQWIIMFFAVISLFYSVSVEGNSSSTVDYAQLLRLASAKLCPEVNQSFYTAIFHTLQCVPSN